MNFFRILPAVVVLLMTIFTADAQQAFTCKWVSNANAQVHQLHNWKLRGTQSRRLTFLTLGYKTVANKTWDYRLVGKGTWEDIGTWNLTATRIAPGSYRVRFWWPGKKDWGTQTWYLPRFIVGGNTLRMSFLQLNKTLTLGGMRGLISFNQSNTTAFRHNVWLLPKIK